MNQEILPKGSEAGLLARPVDLLPPVMVDYMDGLVMHSRKLAAVQSPDQFMEAAELLNNLQRAWTSLNTKRLSLARSYDEARDANINAPAKPYLEALKAAQGTVNRAMTEWQEAQDAIRRKAEAEAEALRQKAEALRLEAEAREAAAAKAVENAKTDKGFTKAAAAFDDGLAAQQMADQAAALAASVVVPEVQKAKGVKERVIVEAMEVVDLSLLPLTYHQPDEKKIRAHILDGTLKQGTPGLKFRLGKSFSATGR